MSADARALVARFFDEMCNAQKLEVADELFAATHVYNDPSHPEAGPGPDGMKGVIAAYHAALTGVHWEVDEMSVADNGTVVTRWTGSGTHTAELDGIAPTGKQVSVPGIWIHQVEDGAIVESWNIWDTLGMLRQLGVVPLGRPAAAQ